MTALHRWCLVAMGLLLIVAAPLGLRLLPVAERGVAAGDLLELVAASGERPYSGYVETVGAVQLPVADEFSDIGTLFGERTRMRVWWQDSAAWRVNRLLVSGETDLVHNRALTTEYDYEDARATTSADPEIRLPRTADLLPPVLGRRLFTGVTAAEVVRLPARRVAGIAAPGLRLDPASDQSSIDHVDLWADPSSGVPLRVEVYAAGSSAPYFTSEFQEFSPDLPADDLVTFTPTPGTERTYDDVLDIADAANQYAPLRPPDEIAGLSRSSSEPGAVGVYGVGVTQLIAIPLRRQEADPLREQLRSTPGMVDVTLGTTVSAGPLGVLLTGADGEGGWLVAGSVTVPTLESAAEDLLELTVALEHEHP